MSFCFVKALRRFLILDDDEYSHLEIGIYVKVLVNIEREREKGVRVEINEVFSSLSVMVHGSFLHFFSS